MRSRESSPDPGAVLVLAVQDQFEYVINMLYPSECAKTLNHLPQKIFFALRLDIEGDATGNNRIRKHASRILLAAVPSMVCVLSWGIDHSVTGINSF